jgi:guanyl-specific ribonuclease Sa
MKKILLYFFLLTSLSFYSQVANEVHCAGDTTFNLTNHNSLLIGNLNPAETTVSYHLTASDATNGVNAISNPTNFIVPQIQGNLLASQTIYARINHLENITTNYFSLIVNPDFHSAARIEPIDCYNYGTIMLDVFGGQAPFACFINGSLSTDNFWLYGAVSTLRIPNLVTGTYTVEIRDAIGCITHGSWTIEPSSIIPLDTPTAAVINATCKGSNNGAITINATGGKSPFSYSIDNGATYVLTNTFTNLAAGNYTVYVKDASDCIQTTNVSVKEPNLLQVSADLTKPIDCISNAAVTVTATGGTAPYTYSKDGITFVQSNVLDNLVAGSYTAYVKDYNGCINSTNSITISSLLPLSISSTVLNVTCNGNGDGIITINTSGGKAPFYYSVDNGVTFVSSNVFKNLVPGTYNITVKDASNCTSSMIATVVEPSLLTMTASITKTIDCISNAAVTVTATGGTAPYTYSKDGITFVQSNIFDNLVAGSYTLYVKDHNGCYIENLTSISPLPQLIADGTATNIVCKGDNDATITISATGGNGQYTYSINGGIPQLSNEFKNLASGTYTIVISSGNCVNSFTRIITEPMLPLTTTISLANQTVTVNTTGGSGTYSYALDGSALFQQSNTFNNITPGSHFILTEDVNGCIVATPVFTINTPAPLVNGNNAITQSFTEGQTLGDLKIAGENIKWYSNATPITGKLKKANETPLPLSTVLTDGTTYYASQTINGIESTERLAVTAKLGSLGTADLVIKDFTYYPNPVKNIFTISNTSIIDEVSLISIKGETLLTMKINSLHYEIDLSNFSKGVYFLKVKAEGTEKTVKLIKE